MNLSEKELDELRELFKDAVAKKGEQLTDWEDNFLLSIEVRCNRYEDRTMITDKQWAVIEKIQNKVYGT